MNHSGGQCGGQQILLLQSPQTNQAASTSPINPAQKVKVVKGKATKNKMVTFL